MQIHMIVSELVDRPDVDFYGLVLKDTPHTIHTLETETVGAKIVALDGNLEIERTVEGLEVRYLGSSRVVRFLPGDIISANVEMTATLPPCLILIGEELDELQERLDRHRRSCEFHLEWKLNDR